MVPSTTYCMVPSNKSYVIQKANVVENLANIKLKLRINTLMQTPYNTHSGLKLLLFILDAVSVVFVVYLCENIVGGLFVARHGKFMWIEELLAALISVCYVSGGMHNILHAYCMLISHEGDRSKLNAYVRVLDVDRVLGFCGAKGQCSNISFRPDTRNCFVPVSTILSMAIYSCKW